MRKIGATSIGLLLAGVIASGCSSSSTTDSGTAADTGAGRPDSGVGADAGVAVRATPTQGSFVVLTRDGQLAVVSNPASEAVQVFKLNLGASPPSATKAGEFFMVQVGRAVIGNDDDTAYVIWRGNQVQEITGLHSAAGPELGRRVTLGADGVRGTLAGIATAKTGKTLWVSNWSDGVVDEIDGATMMVRRRIDLNASLAGSGMLGPNVRPRPGLAHPQAIVATNDGTANGPETVYVTEFFSQLRTDANVPADDSAFDTNRQGVVYRFNATTGEVAPPITIASIADTGFADSNGIATGCFPNQLFGAALGKGKLFVTAVCASPRGPVGPVTRPDMTTDLANIKTQVHAAVFQIDTSTNEEAKSNAVLLTQKFQALYDRASAPDDGTRRMPLIPRDLAFVPGGNIGYVTGYGSDAVFRVAYDQAGAFTEVGSNIARFIDLQAMGGRLPIGIAISSDGTNAVVLSENTRVLQIIALASQNVVATASVDFPPIGQVNSDANLGRRFFVTGTGRWSLRGQAWNSCEACHPNGLTDNVSWFFARGPRQTVSLDGSFSADGTEQRIFNWAAIFDEVHDFELNTRGNSGGVGAIVHQTTMPPNNADRILFDGTTPVPAGQRPTRDLHNGLNGSTAGLMPGSNGDVVVSVLDDWNKIASYVKKIRAPDAPSNLDPADVEAGRLLFQQNNCAACHGGKLWSASKLFYTPNDANNHPTVGSLRTTSYTLPAAFPANLNPPAGTTPGRTAKLRFDGANPAANDQINCVLRAVGTFPSDFDADKRGVAPAGVRVKEVRQDMTTNAQGATGFSPPSLIGVAAGAPYYHAGNARTLEEVFDPVFAAHTTALSANFLTSGDRATQVRQLVAFVLTITKAATPAPIAPPNTLGFAVNLCPDNSL